GVGVGFGFTAKLDLESARETCDGRDCSTQAGFDDMNAAASSAKVATVVCIAGGVALAAGAGLYLLAPKEASSTSALPAGLQISPALGPSQAGLSLSGVFF